MPPFTLYLNVENAQNPAEKHFEKTNTHNIEYAVVILTEKKVCNLFLKSGEKSL